MTNPSTIEPEVEKITDEIIGKAGEVATMPQVTVKIIDIVENPNSNMAELQNVIRNDPALSTRILKIVNSALYGMPGTIANIDRAIVLLGLSAVKNIAIATSMTHLFTGDSSIPGCSANDLWRHSIAVGVGAKLIFNERKQPGSDEAFLAGLIADLGLLIERQAMFDEFTTVIERFTEEGGDFCAIEKEEFGVDHQTIGKALATQWRFPKPISNAIGFHHAPESLPAAEREMPLTIKVADILASILQVGFCTYPESTRIDRPALDQLGLVDAQIEKLFDCLPVQIAAAEKIFEP